MTSQNNKIIAILLELLVLVIQAGAIVGLLILVYGEPVPTVFAAILSIVWTKLSHDTSVQDLMELRAKKTLFEKLGEWLNRDDATDTFDQAHSEHLYLDQGVSHEEYTSLAMAKGVANLWRGIMSILLHLYLIFVVLVALTDHIGALAA